MKLRQTVTFLAPMLLLAFVTGCSVSTPHVEIELPLATKSGTVTLDKGIKYAQRMQAAYREKLSAHARMGSDGGATLITLASVVLGFAAFDVHIDNITGTALAGAPVTPLETGTQRSPRAHLYSWHGGHKLRY